MFIYRMPKIINEPFANMEKTSVTYCISDLISIYHVYKAGDGSRVKNATNGTHFILFSTKPPALGIPYLRNYLYPPLALICTLVTVYNSNPVRRSPPRRPPPCTPAGSSFARPAPSPPPPSGTLSYALTLSSTPSARRRTGRP